jgi:hypothetical protein
MIIALRTNAEDAGRVVSMMSSFYEMLGIGNPHKTIQN